MTEIHKNAILPDEEFREAARNRLSSCLMMEAGAGTGKTTLLIERLLGVIVREGVPVEKIAAITFTQKAAAEMVKRLKDRLWKFVAEAPGLSSERLNGLKALKNFDRHGISTIHSFARKILMGAPFDGGVDPAFEVIDDDVEQEFIEKLWEEWIVPRLEDPEDPFRKGYEAGFRNDFYLELFNTLYRFRDRVLQNPPPAVTSPDTDLMLAVLTDRINGLWDFAQTHCSDVNDKGFLLVAGLKRRIDAIMETPASDRIWHLMEWEIKRSELGTKKAWGDFKDERNRLIDGAKDTLDEIKAATSRCYIDGFAVSIREFMALAEKVRMQEGLVSNDDLLIKATFMLRKNRRVREYFRDAFYRILVDEFQDTDPLQGEMVFLLAQEAGEDCDEWSRCSTVPGKLFFVGDPKQSIYSFRRADIEIYEKVRAIVQKTGSLLPITVNFRSDPRIIGWVNSQFEKLIVPPEDGKYQPAYEPLIPFRKAALENPLIMLSQKREKSNEFRLQAPVLKGEASAIAGFINKLVFSDKPLIPDGEGGMRPVGFGDICILFPKYSIMPCYEDALRTAGIPYQLEGGRLFFHRQEVRDIVTALKAVENPRDTLSVAACLKSPLFSHSDEDLLQAKLSGVSLCYDEEEGKDHPLSQSFELLNRLHKKKNLEPVGGILSEIYEKTGICRYYEVLFPDGRASANLEKLLGLSWDFHESKKGGLRRFIARMEKAAVDGEREEDAGASADLDSVTIMTIHKSKGLEFPVVILAAMAATREPKAAGIFVRTDGSVEAVYGKFRTAGYDSLKEASIRRLKAETVRLLYVAATRAKNMLVLTDFAKTKKDEVEPEPSYYQKILYETLFEENSPLTEQFHRVFISDEDSRKIDVGGLAVLPDERTAPGLSLFGDQLDRWRDWTALAREKGQRHMVYSSYTKESRKEDPSVSEKDDSLELRIGRAYHQVMEMADLTGGRSFDGLLEMICGRENVTDYADDVRSLVNTTIGSGIGARILKAESYYREYPFTVKTPEGYISGAIDLLIKNKDGFTIIDYKSDQVSSSHLEIVKNRYRHQAKIYEDAVNSLGAGPVREVLFFFARLGRAVVMNGE